MRIKITRLMTTGNMKAWGICCCSVGNEDGTQTDIKPLPLYYTPHYSLKQHDTFIFNILQSIILIILYSFLVQVLDHRPTVTARWKRHNLNQCFYSNSRLKPKQNEMVPTVVARSYSTIKIQHDLWYQSASHLLREHDEVGNERPVLL